MTEQGSRRSGRSRRELETGDPRPDSETSEGDRNQRGRLSNPAQRRLADTGIDDLVARYEAGSTIEMLANTFGIHRTTVMAHLERRGVSRRSPRKLTDEMVAEAGRRYVSGETLAQIAAHLGVAPSTLTRELRLAQIRIRSGGRPTSG